MLYYMLYCIVYLNIQNIAKHVFNFFLVQALDDVRYPFP